jgi:hypothetical protein
MSGEDKDPFDCLSQIMPPEPDPEKIKAVAAMSANVFAEGSRKKPQAPKKSCLGNLLPGGPWLLPASGAFATLLVAVVAVPMLLEPTGPHLEAPRDMPMRAPSLARGEQNGTASQQGTRMGSMPQPQRQGMPLDLREDAEVRTYDFDGLRILSRSVPEEFALYLVVGDIETTFDQRTKEASEEIVLTDAFLRDGTGSGADRTLFVRSGPDNGAQRWDAFVDNGTGFVLSESLSRQVADASDRVDVLAKVDETGEN